MKAHFPTGIARKTSDTCATVIREGDVNPIVPTFDCPRRIECRTLAAPLRYKGMTSSRAIAARLSRVLPQVLGPRPHKKRLNVGSAVSR